MKSCHLHNVDGTRIDYDKKNKSVRERQVSYDFTHTWNLRNKTDERKGIGNKIKTERETNHKKLLNTENKLRVAGGEVWGVWAKWVMGIKGGTCDEHWVLYLSDESLNSIPEIVITLSVN